MSIHSFVSAVRLKCHVLKSVQLWICDGHDGKQPVNEKYDTLCKSIHFQKEYILIFFDINSYFFILENIFFFTITTNVNMQQPKIAD